MIEMNSWILFRVNKKRRVSQVRSNKLGLLAKKVTLITFDRENFYIIFLVDLTFSRSFILLNLKSLIKMIESTRFKIFWTYSFFILWPRHRLTDVIHWIYGYWLTWNLNSRWEIRSYCVFTSKFRKNDPMNIYVLSTVFFVFWPVNW